MINVGKAFYASEQNYTEIYVDQTINRLYPLVRDSGGNMLVYCVSPQHGRSYVVDIQDGRYIVLKGSGLTYTTKTFFDTGEYLGHSWGVLNQKDAVRDFQVGNEIIKLGIKTNFMEAVMLLDKPFSSSNQELKCCLLQYSVECPYRISDYPFISIDKIKTEIKKWKSLSVTKYPQYHLIAAEVMFRNLSIMHSHEILHNAIHSQNYTWALELLDFELARTPSIPYENENEHEFKLLYNREMIYTWEIINTIAWILNETIDNSMVENIACKYRVII